MVLYVVMWCYCYCIVTNCSWLFFPGVKQWKEQDSKLGRGRSCWLGKNGDGGGEFMRNFAMPLLNSAACKECVWKMCLWNGDKQSEMDNIRVSEPFFLKTWKMCIREGAVAVWAVQVIGRRSTVMEEKKERFVHSHNQNQYDYHD